MQRAKSYAQLLRCTLYARSLKLKLTRGLHETLKKFLVLVAALKNGKNKLLNFRLNIGKNNFKILKFKKIFSFPDVFETPAKKAE